MGDIYQNPNNKLPKNINNDMGHISKKQQQMMGSGMAQGQQNGGVVKYLQNQTASPSQTFFKESSKKSQHSNQVGKKILPVVNAQANQKQKQQTNQSIP